MTYAEPVYAKTPENPPHCQVPLKIKKLPFFQKHLDLLCINTYGNVQTDQNGMVALH
jgi:hypothetical protein